MINVLLIDDEPNVTLGLERQLYSQRTEFNVSSANTAMKGLEIIENEVIDVILLDIIMSEMTGIELLKFLKSDSEKKHIPVIMLTGCAEIAYKQEALEIGACDFINKPADVHDIIARLRSAVQLKIYEDQLRNNVRELETQVIQSQKMEIIGIFASGIVHDLNNILTGIIGHNSLASHFTNEDDEISRHLKIVEKAGKHAHNLTQQILNFGKKTTEDKKQYDLRTLIEEGLSFLSLKKTVTIWQKPPDEFLIEIIPTLFQQILMNLCINASQAMKDEGTLTITLEKSLSVSNNSENKEHQQSSFYKLTVTDTGPGIDESKFDTIFKPFITTKIHDKGTGLGLAVTRLIIEKLGGSIEVKSEIGTGTSFIVNFPINLRLNDKQDINKRRTVDVC